MSIYLDESEFANLFINNNLLGRLRELASTPRMLAPSKQGLSEAIALLEIYVTLINANQHDDIFPEEEEVVAWKKTFLGVFDSYGHDDRNGDDELFDCSGKRKSIERLLGSVERSVSQSTWLEREKSDMLIELEVIAHYLEKWLGENDNEVELHLAVEIMRQLLTRVRSGIENLGTLAVCVLSASLYNPEIGTYDLPNNSQPPMVQVAVEFINFVPDFLNLIGEQSFPDTVPTMEECRLKIETMDQKMLEIASHLAKPYG